MLEVAQHVLILTDPSTFLAGHAATLGGAPSAYFVDHYGRQKPLIVDHATGRPAFVVEDDGSLSPFSAPAPNPSAAPVTADYRPVPEPAETALNR